MTTIAFDIYGTLIDPLSVGVLLQEIVGKKAEAFNHLWRDKQLEYSFRKAAMKQFNHFTECTRQALIYSDAVLQTHLNAVDQNRLMQAYRQLPAYDAVAPTLAQLRAKNIEVVAFSNGAYEDLLALFDYAGITSLFDQIISVDEVQTFKPAPEVYHLLAQKAKAEKANTWLVSTNSFDIIGALACGLNTVYLQRQEERILDPFGYESTCTVQTIGELIDLF